MTSYADTAKIFYTEQGRSMEGIFGPVCGHVFQMFIGKLALSSGPQNNRCYRFCSRLWARASHARVRKTTKNTHSQPSCSHLFESAIE